MCARSCAHIYDARKRNIIMIYKIMIYIYTHTHNYKAMHTIDATNFNRTYRFDERAR